MEVHDLHRNRVVRFVGTQNNETRVRVEVVSFRMQFLMFQGFLQENDQRLFFENKVWESGCGAMFTPKGP